VDRKPKAIVSLLSLVGLVILLMLVLELGRHPDRAHPAPQIPTVMALSVSVGPKETQVATGATRTPLPSSTAARASATAGKSLTVGTPISPLTSVFVAPVLKAVPSEPVYSFCVVHTYPHDPEAFTQGLVYHDGFIYEGTGLRGRSSLRRVELQSGKILQVHSLEQRFFGEGIAIFGDKLYQLTWQSGLGFIYDWRSFEPLGTWQYEGEGWGLTHDGTHLIMSDGTSTLRFLDPETLQVVRQVEVRARSGPVVRLNELEYVRGEVYANVWQTDRIVRIDPQSGAVVGWIDLSGLLSGVDGSQVDVLNGIAYDAEGDRLFVTGKLWPKLFEIELLPG
jgi:glutamine cyclotransferase